MLQRFVRPLALPPAPVRRQPIEERDQAHHDRQDVAFRATLHLFESKPVGLASDRRYLHSPHAVPVLTIEEPTGGPDPTTISISPDLTDPALPLECTCLWTPAPGVTPQAITDTIIAVLNTVRPLAAHRADGQDTSPR